MTPSSFSRRPNMSLKIKFALIPVFFLTQYCVPANKNTASSEARPAESGQAQETSVQLAQVVDPYQACLAYVERTSGAACLALGQTATPKMSSAEFAALQQKISACWSEYGRRKAACDIAILYVRNYPLPPNFVPAANPEALLNACIAKLGDYQSYCASKLTLAERDRCMADYTDKVQLCFQSYMRSIAPVTRGNAAPAAPTGAAAPTGTTMPSTKPIAP